MNYIRDNFRPDDRLAVVLVNKQKGDVVQRIASADKIAGEEFQRWLRHMNANKYEVYVSMNTLRPAARGRTKADIDQVRHVYLDLDESGPDAFEAILARQDLPKPNYVLNTSPGKCQVVWKAEGFTKEQAEDLQRGLARETNADPAATDCARVLRMPGFYNHKYPQPYYVRGEKLSDNAAKPEHFPTRPEDMHAAPSSAVHPPRVESGHLSQSERDWAYAKRALARGTPQGDVAAAIAKFRQGDKREVHYYAELTVQKAAASLGSPANNERTPDR